MSNKTPKNQPEETESAPSAQPTSKSGGRNIARLFFGIVMLVIGMFAIYSGVSGLLDNKSRLVAPEGVITIETVDTDETRMRGLSRKESIDDTYGMLFVLEQTSTQNCFYMKDMQFSIDMIWLNEDKKVVYIEENVSPDTYPDEIFCPDEPAKYVLEVNAGRASQLGITDGVSLRF